MAEQRIVWAPVNGINMEDPHIRVRPDQCTEALNMLFERNICRTRPYTQRITYGFWPNPSTNKFRFGRGMLVGADNPNSVVILSNGTLAKGPQAQALSQDGAGTLALGDPEFDNITVVNGVFAIGNNAFNGMVRHDPATDLFSIVPSTPFRYYTGLYSRAIGAYSNIPNQVGWSVAGDETDWSGAGSGTSVLAETTDEITGARTVQNILVILRSMGLTLGFPTGQGTAPIRFETVIRAGRQGCPYPSTVADDGNTLFYVGHDNVYRVDMNWDPAPIGKEIRRELLFWLARGVLFRGFTTRMDYGLPSGGAFFLAANEMVDPVARLRYHLVPIQRPGVPHYSFDMESNTWSRHTYTLPLLGGLEGFNRSGSTAGVSAVSWCTLLLLDEATPDVLRWAENSTGQGEIADNGSSISSGVFVVGEPDMEYTCNRAFITWALDAFHGTSEANPPAFEMRIECKQQQRPVAQASDVSLYQVSEAYGDWQGTWVDFKVTGQFFKIRLTIPPHLKIQIAQVTLFLAEGQQTKSANFRQT